MNARVFQCCQMFPKRIESRTHKGTRPRSKPHLPRAHASLLRVQLGLSRCPANHRKSKVEVSFIGERCPQCPITTTSENLSVVWNSTLINKTVWNWQSYVTRLENGWLKDHDVRGDGVDGDGPVQWAVQTHKVAQRIWKLTPESKKLDDNYYRAVLPLLDQQLGLASLRLTRFLEDALGSDNCPELTHAVGSDKECPAPGFGNALTGQ